MPSFSSHPVPYHPIPSLSIPSQAGADEFMERRMCDRFELDVQALQEDAPPDTSASLVALAAQLVEVSPVNSVTITHRIEATITP